MASITPFPAAHVLIDTGRCTGGDDLSLIGRTLHMVSLIDADGAELTLYVGTDRAKADTDAVTIARDFGCRIFDRSQAAA